MSALPTVLFPASEDDPPAQVTLVTADCTNILVFIAPEEDSEARIHVQVVYLGGDSEMHQKWSGERRQRNIQYRETFQPLWVTGTCLTVE